MVQLCDSNLCLSTSLSQTGLFLKEKVLVLGNFVQKGNWLLIVRSFILNLVLSALEKLIFHRKGICPLWKNHVQLININTLTFDAPDIYISSISSGKCVFLLKNVSCCVLIVDIWSWGITLFDEWMNSNQRTKVPNKVFSRRCSLDSAAISLERRTFLGEWKYYFQPRSFSSIFANILLFCSYFYIKCQYR